MEILVALGMAAAMVAGADRLMLWLESRGHVNWRRTGRKKLSTEPAVGLEHLLKDAERSR